MSKDIFVIAEQRDGHIEKIGIELIGKAKELAAVIEEKVVAVLLGSNIKEKAQLLIEYGADSVILVDDPILKHYTTEPYTKAITQIIKTYDPEMMLVGATSIGRDLAPRVSARVHTGLTADCTSLEVEKETRLLNMTRPAFGGNIMATILCENHKPQIATVRSGVMKAREKDASRSGEIVDFKVEFASSDMNVKIREIVKERKHVSDITESKVLVSGGRGIGSAEGFKALHQLAQALDGEVSSSRAAVDIGWMAHDRQVGQTGKTVRPDLYIAAGISGAIQHVAGMENSEFIIAVNKDADARIFEVADLGIVGDLNQIIPKLTTAINKLQEEN